MRNICTEAGMFAISAERDYVVPEDFIKVSKFCLLMMFLSLIISRNLSHLFDQNKNTFFFQAVRKLGESKKLESSAEYNAGF